jgi:hypothetical protein
MAALAQWRSDDPLPGSAQLEDLRFRRLLGSEEWSRLPPAVRRRFSKRLGPGLSVTYRGTVLQCRINIFGWLLAQAARLIGAPLPLHRDEGVAAIVTVTEDGESGGQVWSRLYARHAGFPQVIHSAKRFAGPTGIEEYLGLGFGIALVVSALPNGIRFAGDHYFLRLRNWRLRFPSWLVPGRLVIEHIDQGAGRFIFDLELRSGVFGKLISQRCEFRDCLPAGG